MFLDPGSVDYYVDWEKTADVYDAEPESRTAEALVLLASRSSSAVER
jgi:hypothetical protein